MQGFESSQAIFDAVRVVMRVGFRRQLWVDAVCKGRISKPGCFQDVEPGLDKRCYYWRWW